MKFGNRALGLLLMIGLVDGCSMAKASPPDSSGPQVSKAPPAGFAVVELFTSEGCSSCPPADELLSRLRDEHARDGTQVDVLAFHVDYWNELGWVDPFSAEWATARQRVYADILRERSVYTPQMIINGRDAFVGADRARARQGIQAALHQVPVANLSLHITSVGTNSVAVEWDLSSTLRDDILQLALVEPDTTSVVRGGENAGRTLRHVNVVREFQSIRIAGTKHGTVTLRRPASLEGPFEVIGYVQDEQTMGVKAAAREMAKVSAMQK
jgi:hypothetical protein